MKKYRGACAGDIAEILFGNTYGFLRSFRVLSVDFNCVGRWLYIKNYCLLSIIINYLLLSKMRRCEVVLSTDGALIMLFGYELR